MERGINMLEKSETREDYIKQARVEAENARVSVRNIRRDSNQAARNLNSNSEIFDLDMKNKNIINFPSINHNTRFQGCHLIRNKSLNHYPDIFNIQDYWINCSIEGKLYGYETFSVNPHVGTKELYLKNQ